MKKLNLRFLLLILLYSTVNQTYSQIKVLKGGRVGIATNDVNYSKLHVYGEQYTMPLLLTTTSEEYGYTSAARSQNQFVKNWAVILKANPNDVWGRENFVVYSNGTVQCFTVSQTSDLRLKKNLIPIEGSIEKIKKINGYYYFSKSIVSSPES